MDIFFHVYLKSGYSHILLDKFKKIRSSGLYEKTNEIYLALFGDIDAHHEFLTELQEIYPKIKYASITNQDFQNEPDTLNFMLKKANEYQSNTPMLYIHTKGLSYTNTSLKKNISLTLKTQYQKTKQKKTQWNGWTIILLADILASILH